MSTTAAINIQKEAPRILQALGEAQGVIAAAGLEPKLRHLVTLRASQINGCAFCIKMHVREALEDGETHDRLHRLAGWRHMSDFSPAEKAAFAWTEALTLIDTAADLAPLRMTLREHFGDAEIAALTTQIAMINLWNRIQVAGH
ncbi:MAG: carboxymuconolactone decarboxylase family protein [Caulobacter sp.]|jgi:AhpD family alkylhydroperoxidase|nr:carboxymuconolactone decarboxylase family protein [Caulobacter sp.]